MSLSNKLVADYIELINQKLDFIPIFNIEDFNFVIDKLTLILDNPNQHIENPNHIELRLINLLECYHEPEQYVQNEEDFDEFQEIIKSRIRGKISEFQAFDEHQKQQYIDAQNQQRLKAQSYQLEVSSKQKPIPGSFNHVISLEEIN
jgi:hypothetical protein